MNVSDQSFSLLGGSQFQPSCLHRLRAGPVSTGGGGRGRGGRRGSQWRRGIGPEELLWSRLSVDQEGHHPPSSAEGWTGGARGRGAVHTLPGNMTCQYTTI